jgi:hypothetical protein
MTCSKSIILDTWTGVQFLEDFGNITKKLLRILVFPNLRVNPETQ